ncbi:MAG: hypothetical protein WCV85_06260 [Patescibacteria group bacterium]|jgi:hypothetical protein
MKSLLFSLLIAIAFFGLPHPAQADAGDYAGHQFVLKVTYNPPLQWSRQEVNWHLFGKAAAFFMPQSAFTQTFVYLGPTYKNTSFYGGLVSNWVEKDAGMLGINLDFPHGPWFGNIEADVILHKDFTDFYGWAGVDYNFEVSRTRAWVGPHIEVIEQSGRTTAQGGARLGMGVFELGTYIGDVGWNIRFQATIPLYSAD